MFTMVVVRGSPARTHSDRRSPLFDLRAGWHWRVASADEPHRRPKLQVHVATWPSE